MLRTGFWLLLIAPSVLLQQPPQEAPWLLLNVGVPDLLPGFGSCHQPPGQPLGVQCSNCDGVRGSQLLMTLLTRILEGEGT